MIYGPNFGESVQTTRCPNYVRPENILGFHPHLETPLLQNIRPNRSQSAYWTACTVFRDAEFPRHNDVWIVDVHVRRIHLHGWKACWESTVTEAERLNLGQKHPSPEVWPVRTCLILNGHLLDGRDLLLGVIG